MDNNKFISFDNKEIFFRIWDNVEYPRAVMQIIHGMGEHSGRYDEFGRYLNSLGIIVYATDHREHGKSAKDIKDIGYINDNDIFNMVKDELFFSKIIKDKYSSLPLFLLGHSMGSFILQKYLQYLGISKNLVDDFLGIKGAIIMGSTFRSLEYYLAKAMSAMLLYIAGDKKIKMFEDFLFADRNLKSLFKSGDAWLSNNKENIKHFEKDIYCGHVFSTKFYYELFIFMIDVFRKENMINIPKDIPIFILSGKDDKVGGKSKKIIKLHREYMKNRTIDLNMKLYNNSLHEILHDNDKEEVYNDIKIWLEQRV